MVLRDTKLDCDLAAAVTEGDAVSLEDKHGRMTAFRVVAAGFSTTTVLMYPNIFDHPGETANLHGFDEGDGPQPHNRIVRKDERFWVHFNETGFRLTAPIAQVYINDQPQFAI